MSTILDELADKACARVAAAKEIRPLAEVAKLAEEAQTRLGNFAFENALKAPGVSFICECKKASPSKGIIAQEFPYLEIACEYERAGAECVSVLTEPEYFLGSNDYLREIAAVINIPCIRKDFTVDEYMIYEARLLGASAVLLICSILDDSELLKFMALAESLGLSALVETHDEDEIRRALDLGARLIGVNNRNLKDFSVDTGASVRLRALVGDSALFIAESGIKTPEDVAKLREIGVDAALVGEALMRAQNKKLALAQLRGE